MQFVIDQGITAFINTKLVAADELTGVTEYISFSARYVLSSNMKSFLSSMVKIQAILCFRSLRGLLGSKVVRRFFNKDAFLVAMHSHTHCLLEFSSICNWFKFCASAIFEF